MNDFDRYDVAMSLFFGLLMAGVLVLGAPLWTMALIMLVGSPIILYRHLPLPPRRR